MIGRNRDRSTDIPKFTYMSNKKKKIFYVYASEGEIRLYLMSCDHLHIDVHKLNDYRKVSIIVILWGGEKRDPQIREP